MLYMTKYFRKQQPALTRLSASDDKIVIQSLFSWYFHLYKVISLGKLVVLIRTGSRIIINNFRNILINGIMTNISWLKYSYTKFKSLFTFDFDINFWKSFLYWVQYKYFPLILPILLIELCKVNVENPQHLSATLCYFKYSDVSKV